MFRIAAIAATVVSLGAPLTFTQPTSIELLPSGKLLLVENNPGRILGVDPANGRITVLAKGLSKPYAIVRAADGTTYYGAGRTIRKLGGPVVVRNANYIGPFAVAADGTIYYGTANGAVFATGRGRIATNTTIVSPHGLAIAPDGSVLVSDTGGNRIVRIGADGRAELFAAVLSPRGLDVAPNGTVYVVAPLDRRVARFAADGKALGFFGPALPGDPYDLQVTASGKVYVLESGQVGDIRVIDANGHMTTLRRR